MAGRNWETQTLYNWLSDPEHANQWGVPYQGIIVNMQEFYMASRAEGMDHQSARWHAAQHMKETLLEVATIVSEGESKQANLFTDLLSGSLRNADWNDLAQDLLEEYEFTYTEPDEDNED